jgi:hypothetical protein
MDAAPAAPALDLSRIIKAHINIRDARANLKRDYEPSDKDLKEAQASSKQPCWITSTSMVWRASGRSTGPSTRRRK